MKRTNWVAIILIVVVLVVLSVVLVAGGPGAIFTVPTLVPTIEIPTASPTPTERPTDTPAPTPMPTSTPVAPKELAICQASEPNTLFIYDSPSLAALNVLEAIYDGPIDTRAYEFQPVILSKLPSLADGDVALRTVYVEEGERVVAVNGQPLDLLPGVTVFATDGHEMTFEGGVMTMTQMAVTFTLRTDVTWADGEPLTAEDSVYSFEIASQLDTPSLRLLVEHTQSYKAVDEYTVVWTGLPGYRDAFYPLNFHHPLPKHVWGGAGAEQLLNSEVAKRRPLGWGPFALEEWAVGEHITLVRNPRYFRAGEGLPYLDRVIFRFVPSLKQALDLLAAGQCDVIGRDLIETGESDLLLEAVDAGAVELVTSPSNEWEHLDFGIEPAQWVRRPDFFGDVRVRQAIALCVDRERIASKVPLLVAPAVAHSYVAAEHPLYAGDRADQWRYNPPKSRSLLSEAGWYDGDDDGILEAHQVEGISSRTPFTITLLTTAAHPARAQAAEIIAENLGACGIGVAIQYLPDEAFFADGPDGPVFGRQFDLALFSYGNFIDAPCDLYLSSQIPGTENWWAAWNDPGYASDGYDAACQAALDALPGTEAHEQFHSEAQRIFSQDLPVLPLYFVPKVVAVRPGVSGVTLDPSEYLVEWWIIEAFNVTPLVIE